MKKGGVIVNGVKDPLVNSLDSSVILPSEWQQFWLVIHKIITIFGAIFIS